jgi:DNA-binding response OmpR family regulator
MPQPTRSKGSALGPTITSPSLFTKTNCWRACTPSCAARKGLRTVVRCGDLVVNVDAKRAEVAGQSVPLTGKEYQMLELLALRKGMTISKDMFLGHLYGGMDEPELKIIDVFMCKLRKKLAALSCGAEYIETVWGRGYMLREPQCFRQAG